MGTASGSAYTDGACFCTFKIPGETAFKETAVMSSANDVFMHASVRVGISTDDQCVEIDAGALKTTVQGLMVDGFCVEGSNDVTTLSTAMVVSASAAAPDSEIAYPQLIAEHTAAKTV